MDPILLNIYDLQVPDVKLARMCPQWLVIGTSLHYNKIAPTEAKEISPSVPIPF